MTRALKRLYWPLAIQLATAVAIRNSIDERPLLDLSFTTHDAASVYVTVSFLLLLISTIYRERAIP